MQGGIKMDEKLLEHLNKQINKEMYSAYLYFAMSNYFININMEGFAKVVKEQAKEELNHARKIYNYLVARNEQVVLYAIEAPDTNWINPIDTIKNALAHEQFITSQYNELFELSRNLKDYATEVFLQWFIKEQVEEEDKFRTLLEKMENIDNCDCEIMHIDRNLKIDEEYVE